jgi:hypothetical protein
MKKLPLGFCFLIYACSPQKQLVDNTPTTSSYQQPYHVYTIGKWDGNYKIYTLIDAQNKYFTVKGNQSTSLKKGDVYPVVN